MPRLHRLEELSNLAAHAFLFAAHAGNRQETLGSRVFRRKALVDVDQWPDQPNRTLLRLRNRRKRSDATVEQDIAQERLGTIVGRVTQRENTPTQLRRDDV